MAYRWQLATLKTSELVDIAGAEADSPLFLSQANQAVRRLLKRGNWFDTEFRVKFCIYDRCLTLPEYVASVNGMSMECGWGPSEIYNHWYSIDEPGVGCGFGGIVMEQDGMGPTYNAIAGATGSKVRYHVVKAEDIGKTITIFGTAYGGQPLQEKINGVWREGVTLTASSPDAESTVLIAPNGIQSVVREATQGMTYLYEVYDGTTSPVTLRNLATYGPNETNPRYRKYKLHNFNPNATGCEDDYGRRISALEAVVKLAYVPMVNDWDFVAIDDIDAIRFMVQAIRAEQAITNPEQLLGHAIKEMNLSDRVMTPKDQVVITVNSGARGIINVT